MPSISQIFQRHHELTAAADKLQQEVDQLRKALLDREPQLQTLRAEISELERSVDSTGPDRAISRTRPSPAHRPHPHLVTPKPLETGQKPRSGFDLQSNRAQRPGLQTCEGRRRGVPTGSEIQMTGWTVMSPDLGCVVYLAAGWCELWCHICGANTSKSESGQFNFAKGPHGLAMHIKLQHTEAGYNGTSTEDMLKEIGCHVLTEEEELNLRAGKMTVRSVCRYKTGHVVVNGKPRPEPRLTDAQIQNWANRQGSQAAREENVDETLVSDIMRHASSVGNQTRPSTKTSLFSRERSPSGTPERQAEEDPGNGAALEHRRKRQRSEVIDLVAKQEDPEDGVLARVLNQRRTVSEASYAEDEDDVD